MMHNARVIIMTILLQRDKRGGELVFPNETGAAEKGTVVVAPNIGRVVIFSTVLDVMGREADYHFDQRHQLISRIDLPVLLLRIRMAQFCLKIQVLLRLMPR